MTVKYEREGSIGYVTFDRPEVLNAMNDALLIGVTTALDRAQADPDTRVVVMRGAGRAFCAGADLDETLHLRTLETYRTTRLEIERDIARAVRRLAKPLIAQIHGAAIGGGCVLALLCDLRFAAAGTKFSLPEVKVGTTASLGGIYMLSRIVGVGRAFELLYLGEQFDAERAAAIGLINRVIPADQLEAEVASIATRIAGHFPAELALTREAVLRGLEIDFAAAADLETNAAMLSHLGGNIEPGLLAMRAKVGRKKVP